MFVNFSNTKLLVIYAPHFNSDGHLRCPFIFKWKAFKSPPKKGKKILPIRLVLGAKALSC